jgi:hypothetical protein
MPIPTHFRKDSPNGITPPNLDSDVDLVDHITKRRGMKTPFTSVSEKIESIKHINGTLYSTDPNVVVNDGHGFRQHSEIVTELRDLVQVTQRAERVVAQRALMLTERNREALISWKFDLERIERKNRISWCAGHIQKYFTKV